MASDLDVSTATWGSANLLIASGDSITGATGYGWGTQVAQNTGWLYYQPRPLYTGMPVIPLGTTLDAAVGYAYITAGTYSIYGYADPDARTVGDAVLKFDGTTLVTMTSADAANGSIVGWSTDTSRWVLIRLTGSANAAAISVVSAITFRYGSYAP